ncbi:MAG: flippase [Candidatus Komeilibacteria bacterium]|jgi:O-antigen/teichoic acid export membrane protein|nr:flippase [Candidatus Komeilibacteria bacterium]MBT4447639.1 flippase [Candidatus Komeilibacteria bacterium]
MVSGQKITANTSFFMTALVIQKVLSFVYFTILARSLGAEGIGQYFFAISFASMFSVLIDLGLSPLLIREVAKEKDEANRWFQQIFTLKLIFALLTVAIVVLLDLILFYSDPVRNLIFLTIAIIVIDSFTLLFYAFIRGRQNLKFESWGTIIFQIIVMVMGLSFLRVTNNVFILLTVLFTASLFNMIYSGIVLNSQFKIKLNFYFSKKLVRQIMMIVWPFALAAIFAKVYAYMDTFLLKMFMGDAEVGFYSVAYKITFALQFIPLAFVASLYPAFSNYFKNDSEKLKRTFAKAFNYLAFIALPVTLGIIALATEIINKLYSSDFDSVWPLKVLIAGIPFLFINFSLSSFLNATDRQKINTRNLGIIMIFNIIFNLIFIPRFGVWGASLASTLSTVFLFTLNLREVMKFTHMPIRFFRPLLGSLFSAILMYLAVYYSKDIVGWILSIVVGAVVYLLLMLITKTIKKQDIVFIKNSFRS